MTDYLYAAFLLCVLGGSMVFAWLAVMWTLLQVLRGVHAGCGLIGRLLR